MYSKKSLIVASVVLVLFISVVPSPLHATACWTVMVYLDGDNNLEPAAIDDLNEMEAVGSTNKVNVVVQFDRHAAYDNTNGNWTTCKRYYVTKDANGYDGVITSTQLSDEGELNMGDFNTLANFVTWAKTDYPADHYLLVLWDHGSGWKAPKSDPVKTVCVDETDLDSLTVEEVSRALDSVTCSGGCPLDIVGFDACLMGMLEVDYEIMPYAHYRVSPEEVEPFDGWDYIGLLQFLANNPYALPADVSTKIVTDYMKFYGWSGGETQSAVHLNPTSQVVAALDIFALHLTGAMQYKPEIQMARTYVQSFSDPDYIDLYHFAELIHKYVPSRGVKRDALLLMHAVDTAVIAEGHGIMNMNAHGISIYFPASSAGYLSRYENDVALSDETFWDEFLNQYYNPLYELDASMTAVPVVASTGETVTVTMTVTNNSGGTITSIAPSPLTVTPTGTAHAVLASGPTPATADLTDSSSAAYVWTYQVFSGAIGGTLTFWGNAYGLDSGGEEVFSPLVSSNIVRVPNSNQPPEEPPPDPNEQMQPVADNRIQTVEDTLESLQEQFAALKEEEKDTTPCDALLELVEEYLERARENYEKGNYIAANYWALQATSTLEEAQECLENL